VWESVIVQKIGIMCHKNTLHLPCFGKDGAIIEADQSGCFCIDNIKPVSPHDEDGPRLDVRVGQESSLSSATHCGTIGFR
jgi:hypothetical protein